MRHRSHRLCLAVTALLGLLRPAVAQVVYLSDLAPAGGDGSRQRPYGVYTDASKALMPFRGQSPELHILHWHGALGSLDWAMGASSERPAIVDASEAGQIDTGNASLISAICFPYRTGGHLRIRGIKAVCTSRAAADMPYGISLLGPWQDVVVEGCDFSGFFVNIAIQGFTDQYASGIVLRDNILTDAWQVGPDGHAQGLFVAYMDGVLIERNVIDHNGWSETIPGAIPTIFRHNVYIHSTVSGAITLNNIVARGAASGLRSAGEWCQDNIVLQNPVNIIAAPGTTRVVGNLVMDSRDIDASDPRGFGIAVTADGCDISGNIVAHRSSPSTWNICAIQLSPPAAGVYIHDNVIDSWNGPGDTSAIAFGWNGDIPDVAFYDNRVRMPAGGRLAWGENTTCAPAWGFNQWFGQGQYLFADPVRTTQWMDWPHRQAVIAAAGDAFLDTSRVPRIQEFMALHGGGGMAEYLQAARQRRPWVWDLQDFVRAAVRVPR